MTPPAAWARDGRDWPHRAASRFVAAGGVRWHVQVMGSGPPLLLLHGTGAAGMSWRDIMPALAERFTVVVPDLPGHGFTSPLIAPTLPAMARAVAALTHALDLSPALIAGHSAGAAVAVRLSLDGPPVPVVAFNGALLPFPGMAAAIFPALAKLLFVNPVAPALFALQARGPGVVARFLGRTGSTVTPAGVALYERLFRRSEHVGGALAMMANWDLAALAADFPRVAAPVALVYGDRDATVPPQVSRDVMRRIAGAATIAMPGLGHLAHEEDPVAAARIVGEAADRWGVA